ncbi:MAG: hypothetical protein KIT46_09090 [Anaerolineales bacterium]|nr:hypothetical protein [Anaerolineales bacterium]
MNQNPFESLQFDRRLRVHLSPRTMWLLGVGIGYTLGWWLLPPGTFFWLGLVVMLALAWCALFGWREALRAIDILLHRIERM